MTPSHNVDVLLDDTLLTLNRAVGVLRRRNVAVERLTVRPCGDGGGERGGGGTSRMTFVLTADAAAVDRVVQQFHKIAGVRAVEVTTGPNHPTEEQP